MSKQAVIVGAGPAGISAAIYLVRAGFPVKVIYRDAGALGKAEAIIMDLRNPSKAMHYLSAV